MDIIKNVIGCFMYPSSDHCDICMDDNDKPLVSLFCCNYTKVMCEDCIQRCIRDNKCCPFCQKPNIYNFDRTIDAALTLPFSVFIFVLILRVIVNVAVWWTTTTTAVETTTTAVETPAAEYMTMSDTIIVWCLSTMMLSVMLNYTEGTTKCHK